MSNITRIGSLVVSLVAAPDAIDSAIAKFQSNWSKDTSADLRRDAARTLASTGFSDPGMSRALLDALLKQERLIDDLARELTAAGAKLGPLQKRELHSDQWDLRDQLEAACAATTKQLLAEQEVAHAIDVAISSTAKGNALPPIADASRYHSSLFVRLHAIHALAGVQDPAVKRQLLRTLEDQNPRIRVAVLDALGRQGDAGTVEPIAAMLSDDSWVVRAAAVSALVALKQPQAVSHLVSRLGIEDGRLCDDIARTLESLTGQKLGLDPVAWNEWLRQHGGMDSGSGPKAPALPRVARPGAIAYHGILTSSRAIVFLLDVSESMREAASPDEVAATGLPPREGSSPSRFEIARDQLIRFIASLDENARFNIVIFDYLVGTWRPAVSQATSKNKNDALRMLVRLEPSAGSNALTAIETAFDMAGFGPNDKANAPAFDTLFLLTDGAPAKDRSLDIDQALKLISDANRLRKITIHTIGMSTVHQADFLARLARENGGTYASWLSPTLKR